MSRRDELALNDYLGHIQQAIGRIQRYLGDILSSSTMTPTKTVPFALISCGMHPVSGPCR